MVHCADCGFLSVQKPSSPELEETDGDLRRRWMLPSDPSRPSYKLYKDCPVCFANAVNLAEEIAAYGEFRPETVDAVIRFERDCPRFTPWRRGFSPKEHYEMIQMDEMRRWQERQRESDRQWQEAQRQSERDWQEQQALANREWQQKEQRTTRRLQIALAFMAGAFGLLGAFGSRFFSAPQQQGPAVPSLAAPSSAQQPAPAPKQEQ